MTDRWHPSPRPVALVSCADKPDHEDDDAHLRAALQARGQPFVTVAWDKPAVDWAGFSAALIRTTWDYHHRRAEFVAWAEACAARTLLLNPPEIIRWNTDKRYLRQLEAAGLPLPETIWVEPDQDVDPVEVLRARGWGRGFMKPVIGANAVRTARFGPEDGSSAKEALRAALRDGAMMLQPYLDGVESVGEMSGLWIDGVYAHGVRKVPKAGDWRVQDDWGARDEPYTLSAAENALGEAVIAVAQAQLADPGQPLLYARVDFLKDAAGQPQLMELELVEPSLFLRHGPETAGRLAEALIRRLPRA
jgi:glutathione synthase/RimK-type ligase-like ATP-grasp enzyme